MMTITSKKFRFPTLSQSGLLKIQSWDGKTPIYADVVKYVDLDKNMAFIVDGYGDVKATYRTARDKGSEVASEYEVIYKTLLSENAI